MVSFDQIINKGHKRLASNKNIGRIDIDDDRLLLLHQEFTKEISYNEIDSIIRKKGIIKITLMNGELYELLDALCVKYSGNVMGRSIQDSRNIVRMAIIVYNLLMEKWKNYEKSSKN